MTVIPDIDPYPTWRRWWGGAVLLVQVGLALAAWAFAPQAWQTILGVPLSVFRLMITGVAGLLLVWFGLLLRLPRNRIANGPFTLLAALRRLPGALALLALPIGPALPLLFNHEWIGYSLAGVQFVLLAVLIALSGEDVWRVSLDRYVMTACAALMLLGMGIRLWYLYASWIWIDEGMIVNAAATVAAGGPVSALMFRLPADIVIRPGWGYSMVLYGLWTRLMGVGLLQIRWFSYLAGLLCLPLIYRTVALWHNRRAAWIASASAALSILFMFSTRARNDAPALVMSAVVLFACVYARRSGRALHYVLSGMLAALALEAHLANLIFLFSTGLYLVTFSVTDAVRERRARALLPLLWFGLGSAPFLALYMVLHVFSLPEPALYLPAMASVSAGADRASILQQHYERWLLYWNIAPLEVLLIAGALVGSLITRLRGDVEWLVLFIGAQIGYVLFGPNPNLHYTLYGLPVLLAGVGGTIDHALSTAERHPGRGQAARMALAAAGLLLASNLIVYIIAQNRDRAASAERERILEETITHRLSPADAIISPPLTAALAPAYQNLLLSITADTHIGPTLAGQAVEPYWIDIILQTWPRAKVASPSTLLPELPIYSSYMASRHAEAVLPELLIIPQDGFIPLHPDPSSSALEMVGLWPVQVQGASWRLETLWVTRSVLNEDYELVVVSDGEPLANTLMLSGWAGTPTSTWEAHTFHNVIIEAPATAATRGGSLELRVSSPDNTEQPLPCEPACTFVINTGTR